MDGDRKSDGSDDQDSSGGKSDLQEEQEEEEEVMMGKKPSADSVHALFAFRRRPQIEEMFKTSAVHSIAKDVLHKVLFGQNFEGDHVKKWVTTIANEVNQTVREMKFKRYKHVVHVHIGENKGQGIKTVLKRMCDPKVDTYCTETFINDTIFCLVAIFGMYMY